MSTLTTQYQPAASRPMQGILCIEMGMLVFVIQDAMMKSLLAVYSIWMLIFGRSLVTVLVLVPVILFLGAPHRLFSPLWKLHIWRALLFAIGFSMFYTAFPFMGLAEVTTIFFSAPLITAVFAAIFLKETIGPHRIGALIVGFVGVIIAMNPASDGFTWIAILPLICAVTYAASQVLVRHIGERDSSLTAGLLTLSFAGVLILPMGWGLNQIVDVGPDFPHLQWKFPAQAAHDIPRLALLGLVGMIGWVLISRAYQIASASLIAPFDYTYLPMAVVLGYVLWNEVPPATTWVGMALIVASGLYLGFRELRAARRGDDTPVVAEAVFAPSTAPPAPPEDGPGL